MKRQEAIELYLKLSTCAKITVLRLMQWDSNLSIRENSNKIGMSYDRATVLSRTYGLRYRRVGKGNNYGGVNLRRKL